MTTHDVAAVRIAYDEVAATYAEHFAANTPEIPLDLAAIAHFVSLLPGERRVLDAGCGPGRMMPFLAELGCVVEGIDVSPSMVHLARLEYPGFLTAVGSITDLPYPDACFDGWFSWYSTIHGDDDALAQSLAEARRVLKPDGVALLTFQVGVGVRDLREVYQRVGHTIELLRVRRTPDQVAAACTAAGFTEVARVTRCGPEETSDPQAVLIVRVGSGV